MKSLGKLSGLLIVFLLFVSLSCSNEDGLWDKMKWKFDNVSDGIKTEQIKNHSFSVIYVSKPGSIDIVCKNYKGFWFVDYENSDDFRHNFSNSYCSMTISGNILHCEFYNVDSKLSEEVDVTVTAGDIFYSFKFVINVDSVNS